MHRQVIEAGDVHADLWEGLSIFGRLIDGPEDVVVGDHADYGLAVVSHYGLENEIEWWTQRPIRLPAEPSRQALLCEIEEMLDELDRTPISA